jgi:signal transduction histidine kinase
VKAKKGMAQCLSLNCRNHSCNNPVCEIYMRLTFSVKFTVSVILAVVLTAAILGYSLTSINLLALKNLSRELYLAIAHNVSTELMHTAQHTATVVERSATALANTNISEEASLQLVSEALTASTTVQTIGLYKTDGTFLDALSKGRTVELPKQLPISLIVQINAIVQNSSRVKVGGAKIFGVQRLEPRGMPVIPVLAPWLANGKVVGVVLATVDNETLCRLVAAASGRVFGGIQNQVYLVDDSLRLAAHVEQHRITAAERLAGAEVFAAAGIQVGRLPSNELGLVVEYKRANNGQMVGTFAVLPELRGAIVVEQTQSIAYKPLRTMRLRVIMWGCIGVAAGVLLSIFVARQFVRPVTQLVAASERIAQQDFSARLPEGRNDELGVLFRVHNRMAAEVEEYQRLNVQQIISERNKLEAVVRQASDGVLIVDAALKVMVVNDVFAQWFETSIEAVEGKSLSDVFSHSELMLHIETALKTSEHATSVELRLQCAGEIRETVLRGSMVRVVVDDSLAALATVLRDVTKEVEVDRMKTELVSVVAHELRSPLGSMIGMSELIAEGELSREENMDFASRITAQAQALNSVITKFLDLNRLEAGKTELRSIPFKMDDVARSMLRVNMRLAEKKNIVVQELFPAKLHAAVGDPDLIGQAMLNLFSNAIKYSATGTTICVELVEQASALRFAVRDEGFGVSASSQAKLFTKFFRATDDERVSAETGTGLGLAFVREIVERHGGTVGVESRLNAGSTFWFLIPK